MRLQCDFRLCVAVATAPKGRLPPASLWKPSEPQLSRTFNNQLAQATNPADLSSLNNGSPRRPCVHCNIFNSKCLEFDLLLGVVVTTAPKGTLPPASPWNPTEPQLSRTFNNQLAQTTKPADLSSLNNGSPRRPVSGRGLPLLVGHFIAEMGIGVFGVVR